MRCADRQCQSEITLSSKLGKRQQYLAISCGSKLTWRSRGLQCVEQPVISKHPPLGLDQTPRDRRRQGRFNVSNGASSMPITNALTGGFRGSGPIAQDKKSGLQAAMLIGYPGPAGNIVPRRIAPACRKWIVSRRDDAEGR
jgi:hypothetical protein